MATRSTCVGSLDASTGPQWTATCRSRRSWGSPQWIRVRTYSYFPGSRNTRRSIAPDVYHSVSMLLDAFALLAAIYHPPSEVFRGHPGIALGRMDLARLASFVNQLHGISLAHGSFVTHVQPTTKLCTPRVAPQLDVSDGASGLGSPTLLQFYDSNSTMDTPYPAPGPSMPWSVGLLSHCRFQRVCIINPSLVLSYILD